MSKPAHAHVSCRNSEIYNHEEVKAKYLQGVNIVKDSKSDSAIIGHLYEVRGLALPFQAPGHASGQQPTCSRLWQSQPGFASHSRWLSMHRHAACTRCWEANREDHPDECMCLQQLWWSPLQLTASQCQECMLRWMALCSFTAPQCAVWCLQQKLGDSDELWNALDGIFACVLLDEATGEFMAARDPIGVCSFYWGKGKDGSTWFASEMKALQANCTSFDIFPPVRLLFAPSAPVHAPRMLGEDAACDRRP